MIKGKLTAKPKLGFLGTGLMGSPMTLRLLNAGYEVSIWNRTREKTIPLLNDGANESKNPAEVAHKSEIIFMCLTDGEAVEQVVFGDRGVVKGGCRNKLLVDFSSISPNCTRDFAQRLKSKNEMNWVDAPVSGGVKGAIEGSLSMLGEAGIRMGIAMGLAFEVTDRNGPELFERSLEENIEVAEKYSNNIQVTSLMGLHASFTLGEKSLRKLDF